MFCIDYERWREYNNKIDIKFMDIFTTGIIVLLVMTAIFYVVLFSFIYYWHLKKISYVVVPVFFTFDFFIIGFFTVCIAAIILNYLPVIFRLGGV